MGNSYQQQLDDEIRLLKGALTGLDSPDSKSKAEWLQTLYKSFSDRFLSDNGRIWTTGSIMIPLSLAPFAVLPAIKQPHLVHFIILGLASITVYLAWLVIAENHRQFQDKSLAWIIAIQQTIGLTNTGKPKVGTYWLTKLVTVRRMRYAILFELIIGWIAAAMWWQPVV